MYRVLLAAAAAMAGLSIASEAADFGDGYYDEEPGYRHYERRAYAPRRRKPYHVGVGGMIIVDEPYGQWIYEDAVRNRPEILWGR